MKILYQINKQSPNKRQITIKNEDLGRFRQFSNLEGQFFSSPLQLDSVLFKNK